MRRRAFAGPLAVLAGAALAAGCAPTRGIVIEAGGGEAGSPCTAGIDGRRIVMRDFPAFARRHRGREAHIRGSVDTPYRCIGQLIFELQRAGVRQIGFISEPPLTSDQ